MLQDALNVLKDAWQRLHDAALVKLRDLGFPQSRRWLAE